MLLCWHRDTVIINNIIGRRMRKKKKEKTVRARKLPVEAAGTRAKGPGRGRRDRVAGRRCRRRKRTGHTQYYIRKRKSLSGAQHVFANHTFLYFGVRDKLPSPYPPLPPTGRPSVRQRNHTTFCLNQICAAVR